MALEKGLPDLSSESSWQQFLTNKLKFQAADVETCTTELVRNGTTKDTLLFIHNLPKNDGIKTLKELGIPKLGCVLAILGFMDTIVKNDQTDNRESSTSQLASVESSQRKLPPAIRPTATLDMAPQHFRKFCHDWQSYKESYKIPDTMVRNYLYQCCSADVQTYVYATHPMFLHPEDDATEEDALSIIQSICVRKTHPLVYRMTFCAISQAKGESCQDFLSRIRVAVPDCDYTCPKQTCKADLSSIQVRDQFVRGLYNPTLQALLLKSASGQPDIELSTLLTEAQNFEQSLRDQQTISAAMSPSAVNKVELHSDTYSRNCSDEHAVMAFNSNRQQRSNVKFRNQKSRNCDGCGSASHLTSEREQKCPAWNERCSQCGYLGHLDTVCRGGRKNKFKNNRRQQPVASAHAMQANPDVTGLVSDFHCLAMSSPDPRLLVPVSVTPYRAPGLALHTKEISVFADTGANLCMMGPQQMDALGLSVDQLTPCQLPVSVVGGSSVKTAGRFQARIDLAGNTTDQTIFFCDKADRFFLGRQACKDLKMIPPSFPFQTNNNTFI